ncbi:hypothetical protein LCGC14_2547590, partial [marine sediment metagenome]
LIGFEESFNSFPAIPAHVSAFGRMHLWELMQTVGIENYFYCDTDSLIINSRGLRKLENQLDNFTLGGLKIEESMTRLSIRGLKDYTTASKTVIKGIRKNAVEIRSGVYQQEQWPSFKGLLRSGDVGVYIVKKITKVLNREYTKGTVNQDGSIEPLHLTESVEIPVQLF